ncbi:hypothetical protein HOD75_00170 [archaeon]|jgi:hypothetical protein|nr:hypothetical protein [Candidatus Woesearchaeota archaeon]MBT4136067.1 hypothetical protein [archaeon]MBT4241292.1 hypothetical protein [archaeon]MBT4418114.1 hypothetical protein [archaeon]
MSDDIENRVGNGSESEEANLASLEKIEPPQTDGGEFSVESSMARKNDKKGCGSVLGVLGGIGVGISYFGSEIYESIVRYF